MNDDLNDKIDALARQVRDELLSESPLYLLQYIDPAERERISYQHMLDELEPATIARAKKQLLEDLRAKVRRKILDADRTDAGH